MVILLVERERREEEKQEEEAVASSLISTALFAEVSSSCQLALSHPMHRTGELK